MAKMRSKARRLGDEADLTEEFFGCVKFSMMMDDDEVEMLKALKFVNHMESETGFERPPIGHLYWSRELLLLTGEIGPDVRFSLREVLDAIVEKLVDETARRLHEHALSNQ